MIVMTEYTFHATSIIYTHFDKILNIKSEILNIKSLSQVTWLPAKARPFVCGDFFMCAHRLVNSELSNEKKTQTIELVLLSTS